MPTDVKQLLDQAVEIAEEERAILAIWVIENLAGEAQLRKSP